MRLWSVCSSIVKFLLSRTIQRTLHYPSYNNSTIDNHYGGLTFYFYDQRESTGTVFSYCNKKLLVACAADIILANVESESAKRTKGSSNSTTTPSWRTRMRSHWMTVLRRWAIVKIVQSLNASRSVRWTNVSVCVSMAAVASSSKRICNFKNE